jgi:hypothetical protein
VQHPAACAMQQPAAPHLLTRRSSSHADTASCLLTSSCACSSSRMNEWMSYTWCVVACARACATMRKPHASPHLLPCHSRTCTRQQAAETALCAATNHPNYAHIEKCSQRNSTNFPEHTAKPRMGCAAEPRHAGHNVAPLVACITALPSKHAALTARNG